VDPQNTLDCVSGILDWDSAIFAPSFLAYKPPSWIWDWQDDEDEDELSANDDPKTAEARELKLIFEEAAGPVYARFAYVSVYRLARRLVRFALFGIRSSEDCREADEMLHEWSAIQQGLTRGNT